MKSASQKSVEPNVADLVNGWLKSYDLDYKLEQESLNPQIDKALEEYHSKSGGVGGNRPDAKLLLRDTNLADWPILIEYKGYKDRLVKFSPDGQIANRTAKNEPDYKNINSYAVNGAVHYANALLHYTDYTDIIAIGVTGWKDATGAPLLAPSIIPDQNNDDALEIHTRTQHPFHSPPQGGIAVEVVPPVRLGLLRPLRGSVATLLRATRRLRRGRIRLLRMDEPGLDAAGEEGGHSLT